jgi:hypothetical protein
MERASLCFAYVCKNVESSIESTLESVSRHIDYWVILDTGSTDNTCNVIRNFYEKRKIPGELHIEDNSKSKGLNKNKLFELCYKKTDYILHFDSGYKLSEHATFQINKSNIKNVHTYRMNSIKNSFISKVDVIFNNHCKWIIIGVGSKPIFYSVDYKNTFIIKNEETFISSEGGNDLFQDLLEDALLLKEQFFDTLCEDPYNINLISLFHCAQNYFICEEFKEAKKWYVLYTKLNNNSEETFESYLKIAQCEIMLNKNITSIQSNIQYASKLQPDRSEPFFILGGFMLDLGKFELAYYCFKKCLTKNIKQICDKYFFSVNKLAYNKDVYSYLAKCCFYTKRMGEFRDLFRKILKKDQHVTFLNDVDEKNEQNFDIAKPRNLSRISFFLHLFRIIQSKPLTDDILGNCCDKDQTYLLNQRDTKKDIISDIVSNVFKKCIELNVENITTNFTVAFRAGIVPLCRLGRNPLYTAILYLKDSDDPTLISEMSKEDLKHKSYDNAKLHFCLPRKLNCLIFNGGQYLNACNERSLVINVWNSYTPEDVQFYQPHTEYPCDEIRFEKLNKVETFYDLSLKYNDFSENSIIDIKKKLRLVDDAILYCAAPVNEIKNQHMKPLFFDSRHIPIEKTISYDDTLTKKMDCILSHQEATEIYNIFQENIDIVDLELFSDLFSKFMNHHAKDIVSFIKDNFNLNGHAFNFKSVTIRKNNNNTPSCNNNMISCIIPLKRSYENSYQFEESHDLIVLSQKNINVELPTYLSHYICLEIAHEKYQ